MNTFKRNIFAPGRYNNYLIAGNITRNFAIGEVGSPDEFYLVGIEPLEETPYPMLSGNILDSNGDLLFKLIKNVIVSNPQNCYKIVGDFIGYEIVDSEGKMILKVETKFHKVPDLPDEYFFTTIKANFYNKQKQLVFIANSGEENERVETSTKMVFGQGGVVMGYSEQELDFVNLVLNSNGTIYEPLTGLVEGKELNLDGKCLINATIKNCHITISEGNMASLGKNSINDCRFSFVGNAKNIVELVESLKNDHKSL